MAASSYSDCTLGSPPYRSSHNKACCSLGRLCCIAIAACIWSCVIPNLAQVLTHKRCCIACRTKYCPRNMLSFHLASIIVLHGYDTFNLKLSQWRHCVAHLCFNKCRHQCPIQCLRQMLIRDQLDSLWQCRS